MSDFSDEDDYDSYLENEDLFTTEFDQDEDVIEKITHTESKNESIMSAADSDTTALSYGQDFITPIRRRSASKNSKAGNQAARNNSAFKGKLVLNSPVNFEEFQLQQLPDGYVKIEREGLPEPVIVSNSRRDKATKALSSMAILSIMKQSSCKSNCKRHCYSKFNVTQLTSTRFSIFATTITSEQHLNLFLAGVIRTQNCIPSPNSNPQNQLVASKRLIYFICGVQVCLQFFCRVRTRQNQRSLFFSLFLCFSHTNVPLCCTLFVS